MKAILLSAAMTLALFALVTLALRLAEVRRRVRCMTLIFLACVALLVLLWSITPDDLGFLPRGLLSEPRWLDLPLALFFFAAAFFGGVLQLYNLADRGYSLRILIDVLERPEIAGDLDRMMANYSRGAGIDWMFRKRVEGMVASRLVRRSDDSVILTPRGAGLAAAFLRLRRFLRIDGEGQCPPR